MILRWSFQYDELRQRESKAIEPFIYYLEYLIFISIIIKLYDMDVLYLNSLLDRAAQSKSLAPTDAAV